MNVRPLTDREKAAILFQIITGATWEDAYIIASAERLKDIQQAKGTKQSASRWKNSVKVQEYRQQQITLMEAREKAQAERIAGEMMKGQERTTGESERTNASQPDKVSTQIDYNNPANRLKLYNDIITQAQDDPKTQLDAAKLLEQIQKDDRTAAKEQRQTRFYLPQTCDNCPFYAKKAGKK